MRRFVRMFIVTGMLFPIAAAAQLPRAASGDDDSTPEAASRQSKDEAAIRKLGVEYIEAFNKHDAKAIAGFWSPDAVYTNRFTGEQVTGREAIEKQFTAIFEAEKQLKLDLAVESVQFISPNVAVEHGVATVMAPDSEPDEVAYSAVHVRRDGKWLLDRVTDEPIPVAESNYRRLKELGWLIGRWVDEDENVRIVTDCKWTKKNSFITRSFTVEVGDEINMSGMQIIGWDAAAKRIRSWTFDSEGGFAEGQWTRKGDRWFVRKTAVLTDGSKASSLNIIKYLDDDSFTLQSTQRTVGGELLPNVDEVRIVRAGRGN